jgi:hypothetical protein
MQAIEFVARTIFYHVPDGRIVFRPWGTRGPCYLVTAEQKRTRARLQAFYYALMIAVVSYGVMRLGTMKTFLVLVPLIVAGNYVLFWLFTRGLATTEPPPRPSPMEFREQMRQGNRALGKPLLVSMLVISLSGAALGLYAGFSLGLWSSAVPVLLFCGSTAAVFAWQLRNL